MAPIDDWEFWGEDEWYAGVIWKKWVQSAQINCETTVTCQATLHARPTFGIDLESTVEVDESYLPQAGADINLSSNVTALAFLDITIDPENITMASSVTCSAGVSLVAVPNNIISVSTITVNETHTPVTQPDEVSNLVMWYDASSYDTVIDGADSLPVEPGQGGTKVKEWRDRHGSTDLVDGSISARRPTWQENRQNGLPAILFDGSNHFLRSFLPASFNNVSSPYTILIVGANTSLGQGCVGLTWLGTNDPALVARQSSGASNVHLRNNTTNELESQTDSGVSWSAVVVNSGAFVRNVNGSSATTSITEAGTPGNAGTIYAGFDPIAGAESFGELCEILVYDAALNNATIDELGEYFTSKWGL